MKEIDVTKVEVDEYLKDLLNKYYALSKIPDLPSIENTIKKYFDKEYQSLLNLNDNEYSSKRCVSFSLTKYNFERLKVYNDEFGGFISLTEEEVKLLFELTQLHGYIKKNEHLLDLFNKEPVQKKYYDKSLQSLIEKEISKIDSLLKKDSTLLPSNKIEIDHELIKNQLYETIALYCDRYEKQFSEKFDNYYGDRIAFCNKKLAVYNNDTIAHLAEIDNGTFIPDLDKSGKIISLAHSVAHIKLIKFIHSKLQTELNKDQISDLEKRENEIKQSELRLAKLESALIRKKEDLAKKEDELDRIARKHTKTTVDQQVERKDIESKLKMLSTRESELEQKEQEIKSNYQSFLEKEGEIKYTKKAQKNQEKDLDERESKLHDERKAFDEKQNDFIKQKEIYQRDLRKLEEDQEKMPTSMQWHSKKNTLGTIFGELIDGGVIETESKENANLFIRTFFIDQNGVPFPNSTLKKTLNLAKVFDGARRDIEVSLITKLLISILEKKSDSDQQDFQKNRHPDYQLLKDISQGDKNIVLKIIDEFLEENNIVRK